MSLAQSLRQETPGDKDRDRVAQRNNEAVLVSMIVLICCLCIVKCFVGITAKVAAPILFAIQNHRLLFSVTQ